MSAPPDHSTAPAQPVGALGHDQATVAGEHPRWFALAYSGHTLTTLLLVFDAIAIACLWIFAYELRYFFNALFENPINEIVYYTRSLMVVVPLWLLVAASWGLYVHRERLSSLAQMRSLLGAAKDGLLASFAVAFLLKEYSLGRSVVLMASFFIFVWFWASRTGLRALRRKALAVGIGLKRALVVGTGETARRVMARLARHPEIGYVVVGAVSTGALNGLEDHVTAREDPDVPDEPSVEEPVLGGADRLPEIIDRERIEEVFFADPDLEQDAMLNLIARCAGRPVDFKICSNIMEVITDRVKIDEIGDLPVIQFRKDGFGPLQAAAKRLLDVVVAAGLLIVFAIPMLLIAAWTRLRTGPPILFAQERIGRGGKPFTMYKFRTMTTETRPYEVAPTDPRDPRITPLGRFLRKTSLDELPQLFNVLKGEMSMVGPRPEMPFIVERYQEWQRQRLSVKPGITGLWQIIGRKNLPLAQHLEYDFYYIKNQSLMLDVLILIRTIPAVVFGRGAF